MLVLPLDLPILLVACAVDSYIRKNGEKTISTYDRPKVFVYYLNVSTRNVYAAINDRSMKN